MSKDKLSAILDSSFDNGTPFIDYTSNYVYCLIPLKDGSWKEVSYVIPDAELDERALNATKAFRMIVEEVEKGISSDIEDFMLGDFRDFRNSIDSTPDEDKIMTIIKELTENGEKYSKNLPIVKTKADLDSVKAKLKQ